MLTSNNSMSGDSMNSSEFTELKERSYRLGFEEEKTLNDECSAEIGKDERYWERRRKNNAAAKRSRERRRQHDMDLEEQIQRLKLLNSLLQRELVNLRQRLAFKESMINLDQFQSCSQNVDKNTMISMCSLPTQLPCLVSTPILKDESVVVTSVHCDILPTHVSDPLLTKTPPVQISFHNPIDLSCKFKEFQSTTESSIAFQSKDVHKSNSHGHMDQKYWDRRRRNNEAVRKCRQNKRARIMSSLKVGKENNEQIQIKIESISFELEKLKSQIKNPDHPSLDISIHSNGATETTTFKQEDVLQYSDKKILKWKTKLIEADQADQEMC